MARTVAVAQVDAFTTEPFGGNPAGVVLEADSLSEGEMRQIASEMNVAETAFINPARHPADYRLRWFTPSGQEVTFCGHATVATAHLLDEQGRFGRERVVFETLGGALPVGRSAATKGTIFWLEPALGRCTPYLEALPPFLAALGLARSADWARPALTGDGDLLIPVETLAEIQALEPNFTALGTAARAARIRGVCAVTLQGIETPSLTHVRFFAPHCGIPEDPVTGSVHATIPLWLWNAGQLPGTGPIRSFIGEQGNSLGRPGRLRVELVLEAGSPSRVRVGGQAVTVLTGTLRLD